jgi:hypothetical protein
MSRNYGRLDIETFGRYLLTTGDLDPVYQALAGAVRAGDFSASQLKRWLIAYWSFYHCGVASFASEFEGFDFWSVLMTAAKNEQETPVGGRWPRGHERRHFRAKLAIDSVEGLMLDYSNAPETMVDLITFLEPGAERLPFKTVSNRVQQHRGFGPWIGFKVADMVDRVMGIPVDFDAAAVFMFKDPEKAAWMLWEQRTAPTYPKGTKFKREAVLNGVTNALIKEFSRYMAPPFGDRPVNIQEVETVLCKWKSHMNGHYPLGNDITEIRDGLLPWARNCRAAEAFEAHMPSQITSS